MAALPTLRRRFAASSWMPELIIAAVGIAGAAALLAGVAWLSSVSDAHMRANHAAMHMNVKIANAHLWLEEALQGDDRDANEARALSAIDATIRMGEALRNGGNMGGRIAAETVPAARARLEVMLSMLERWRDLASERLAEASVSGAGTPRDVTFDFMYESLQRALRAHETHLNEQLAEASAAARAAEVAVGITLLAATALGLWVFVRLLRSERAQRTTLEERVRERTRSLDEEVAARRSIEADLRKSEARLRDIFDNTSELIQVVDLQGRFLYVNRAWREKLGYTDAEAARINLFDLAAGHETDLHGLMAGAMESGEARAVKLQLRASDGQVLSLEGSLTVRSEAGRAMALRAILRDISDLEEAEDRLRATQARVALALHGANLGSWDWNLQSGEFTVSGPSIALLGFQRTQIRHGYGAWSDVLHPDDLKTVAAAATAHLDGRSTLYEMEYRVRDGNGGWRWLLDRGRVVQRDAEGRALRAAGTHLDITERKQAAADLARANARLEESARAKDQFLATMSHEIRTPLNGLTGMLELLELTRLGDDQRGLVSTARDSGRQLLQIVGDVLDYSKIEAGRLELALEPVSVAELVRAAEGRFACAAAAKRLALTVTLDPRIAPALEGDPLRIGQILNNFISNALKFTHQGGVEVGTELLQADAGRQRVRLYVRDTGVGISPQDQARIFDCYAQGALDTARMYGGTGLGLTICRRLAELMQGHVALQSAPGRGTTIEAVLSLATVRAPATERATGTERITA